MHDPTEGGVATGIWELATAGGVGIRVREEAIHVFPETRSLCDALALDPMGLLASGALLMAVAKHDVDRIVDALLAEAIPAYEIGEVVGKDAGVRTVREGNELPLLPFERDEIARVV